jgi:hypothetical protein
MERKQFLGSVAGAGALLTMASAALAVPVSPVGAPSPQPSGAPKRGFRRDEAKSNKNIREIRRHLDKVIDELQHDQHDYAGHREKALDLLNRARQELLQAEQADRGAPAPTARPM